jgi:hypothetical protein
MNKGRYYVVSLITLPGRYIKSQLGSMLPLPTSTLIFDTYRSIQLCVSPHMTKLVLHQNSLGLIHDIGNHITRSRDLPTEALEQLNRGIVDIKEAHHSSFFIGLPWHQRVDRRHRQALPRSWSTTLARSVCWCRHLCMATERTLGQDGRLLASATGV